MRQDGRVGGEVQVLRAVFQIINVGFNAISAGQISAAVRRHRGETDPVFPRGGSILRE